jgi:TRAP-type mannitol/chloroaromatic compound transport system permease small subunit
LTLSRAIDLVNTIIGKATYWLVLVVTLVGAYNAVVRALDRRLGTQLSANTYLELQWYMFSIIFLFGAAYALKQDAHVRVDVVFGNISERARAWIDLLGSLLFLIPFCAILLYVSIPYVENSIRIMETSPDPGGLPRWPIKLAIPIAFGALILQGVSQAIKNFAYLRGALERREPDAPAEEAPHG